MTDLAALRAKLRKLEGKAKPGRWAHVVCSSGTAITCSDEEAIRKGRSVRTLCAAIETDLAMFKRRDDAAFVCASRNVMGLLLDVVEAATEIVNTPKNNIGIPVKTPNDLIRDMDRISAALSRLAAAEVGP